ncbi:MAG TPA: hypothetical protein VNO43_06185 [Candidatus Eisenbacteria bacterium]|nr:hypothetical protein [Candidatus Eisenbacteria bacterium]
MNNATPTSQPVDQNSGARDRSEDRIDYARDLRALGSALASLGVEAFEARRDGANYVVRVTSRKNTRNPLRDILESAAIRVMGWFSPNPPTGAAPELVYTPDHLVRLDRQERQKRNGGHKPDPHSLPQALRAIGAYVEQKRGRLVEIRRADTLITITYETPQAGCITEEFTPPSLYSLFVRRYFKRHERDRAPRPVAE